jgi:flagellar biosynthesis protein FlhA
MSIAAITPTRIAQGRESPAAGASARAPRKSSRDIGFAIGIIAILSIFFLPIPSFLIDLGLAFSIALSVLILMVALWIERPLDFSAFPTVLLVATLLRLALNIATTRLILSNGSEGSNAAGFIIGGFSRLVMSGDFVIGLIVFAILLTINFVVITKGATRIAEVGARFTLDAIPGKQMAIDADLSAGLLTDKEAQSRRRELEEESAFFGSMDGASKFVRGDAVAGLIILAVNVFGGIVIGVTRHGMPLGQAADVFAKLSVGDGLVSQIPALIVSLGAALLVSKGGTRGSTDKAVLNQLVHFPRALFVAALLMFLLAVVPGLPFFPFAMLGGIMVMLGYALPRRLAAERDAAAALAAEAAAAAATAETKDSVKEFLRTAEIEIAMGKQLAARLLPAQAELAHRVTKMRRKFARQYGFVVPEIKVSDSIDVPPKSYQIKIHGTVVVSQELRLGEFLVITGDGPKPDLPGIEVREPAFGMKAQWVSDAYVAEAKRQNFQTVDTLSILLTHLSEVIRNNLAQLLSYKDMRGLFERLEPEYRKLIDDICPSQISYSGLQAVLKLLLGERVSIRNLHLILEAVAEIVPHVRRSELVAEHVRVRMAQQICGDLADNGALKVLRLGNRWDLAFHQSVKRDGKGEVSEFELDPRLVEQFGQDASAAIRERMDQGHSFVLIAAPEVRTYVRMIVERMFATLPVLSHLEIARGLEIKPLGTIS